LIRVPGGLVLCVHHGFAPRSRSRGASPEWRARSSPPLYILTIHRSSLSRPGGRTSGVPSEQLRPAAAASQPATARRPRSERVAVHPQAARGLAFRLHASTGFWHAFRSARSAPRGQRLRHLRLRSGSPPCLRLWPRYARSCSRDENWGQDHPETTLRYGVTP
jgi:hypothetical protein